MHPERALPPPLPRPRFAPSLPAGPPTPPTPPPGPAVITLVTLRAAGAHDWHCAHSSAAQTLVARSVTLRLIAAESAFAGLGDLAHIWVPFPSERILTPPPRHAHLRLPFPTRFRNARGTEHEVHTSRYDLCHHGAVGPGSVVQLPRDGVVILDLSWA